MAALQALGVVQEGVVSARQLDDPGDQRRLGEVEVGHVLVEVGLRCRLHPVRAVAQVHGVQVLQQDEVLAVLVLQPGGVPDLLQLAAGRLFGIADDGQLHVLLRDGGSALADASLLQVGACRPDDGLQVEAVVDVEALVLDGDDGVADHLGDLVQGAGAGPVLGGHERDDVASVVGHDHGRLGLLGDRDVEVPGLVAVAGGGHGGQRRHHAGDAHEARGKDPHLSSLAARQSVGASGDGHHMGSRPRRGMVAPDLHGRQPDRRVRHDDAEAPYWWP